MHLNSAPVSSHIFYTVSVLTSAVYTCSMHFECTVHRLVDCQYTLHIHRALLIALTVHTITAPLGALTVYTVTAPSIVKCTDSLHYISSALYAPSVCKCRHCAPPLQTGGSCTAAALGAHIQCTALHHVRQQFSVVPKKCCNTQFSAHHCISGENLRICHIAVQNKLRIAGTFLHSNMSGHPLTAWVATNAYMHGRRPSWPV